MVYYFVVEENISNVDGISGKRFICKGGHRYDYGDFNPKHGYTTLHKAEVEVKAALRFNRDNSFKTNADKWKFFIEKVNIPNTNTDHS